jgi:MarR family transcriptional regulator for hemolysin
MITKTYGLHTSTGYWVTLLARTMESYFEKRLKAHGVTRATWVVLSAIHNGAAKTPAAIATFIGVDCAAITRHLDRLEKLGLLERKPSATDRRSIVLKLTNKGKRLIPKIAKHSRETNEKFLKGLTSAEIDAIQAIIVKMLANSDAPPKHI